MSSKLEGAPKIKKDLSSFRTRGSAREFGRRRPVTALSALITGSILFPAEIAIRALRSGNWKQNAIDAKEAAIGLALGLKDRAKKGKPRAAKQKCPFFGNDLIFLTPYLGRILEPDGRACCA